MTALGEFLVVTCVWFAVVVLLDRLAPRVSDWIRSLVDMLIAVAALSAARSLLARRRQPT